jgi:hypothetical protein
VRWLLMICVLPLLTGCGGPAKAYKTAKVSGAVTIDKTPVEKGTINFISESATGARGEDSAEIIAGKFTAKSVPIGKVRVYFIANKETGKMIPGSGTDIPEVVSIVPAQYSQGIEVEIAGDEADRKFDLVSPPPP